MIDGKCGKKQVVIDITDLRTDYEVFEKLNEVYRDHRGAWRALTVAKNLRLCKVTICVPTPSTARKFTDNLVVPTFHSGESRHSFQYKGLCNEHAK